MLSDQLPNNIKCPGTNGGTQNYLESIEPTRKSNQALQILLEINNDKVGLFVKTNHISMLFFQISPLEHLV